MTAIRPHRSQKLAAENGREPTEQRRRLLHSPRNPFYSREPMINRKLNRRSFLIGAGAAGGMLSVGLPGHASLHSLSPFPELQVAGSPGTLGVDHGRRFRVEIERNLAFYDRWLGTATKQDPTGLRQQAARFENPMREHVPHLLEEAEGIAKGARLSLHDILLLNARTDLLVTGRKLERPKAEPGCTALALVGEGGGSIALGQNWDWNPALRRNTCLLRLDPKDGPRIVTFTEAGMVGKIGMGENHVGVCLNFLSHKSEHPDAEPGVPIHVLLRAAMASRSLQEVERLVTILPRSASANLLVAEHEPGKAPRACDIELAPTNLDITRLSGRALFHTNHFVSATLGPGCASGHGISTMNRFQQAKRLVTALDTVDDPVQRMESILKDRTGAPYSISRTPGEKSATQTLAGIVMDLTRNQLHLAQGPTHNHLFVSLPGV